MPAFTHAFSIVLAIVASYIWLHSPWLLPYSLQACAASTLLYVFIKRNSQAKIWHLAPKVTSLEMPIITFTILLLIGATGNTTSVWFPLTFVHLFLLAMASDNVTAVTGSLAVVIFHYAMTPVVDQSVIISLANIPLVLFFFLFAKTQYHEAIREEVIISHQEGQLEEAHKVEKEATYFINEVLLPKLAFMQELIENPLENAESVRGQIMVMEEEALRAAQRLQKDSLTPQKKAQSTP